MAFPSSPTNGQTATVGGITYSYNSTKTAWTRVPSTGANISVFSTVITGTTNSTTTTTGALQVAGGVGIQGNVVIGGSIRSSGSILSTQAFSIAMSVALG
jgi:hypothetical protein